MKDLFEYVVKNIVEEKEKVGVKEVSDGDIIRERVSVSENEMGKIIGKGGKVVKSLRILAKIYSIKNQRKFYLEIADPKMPDEPQDSI